MTSRRAGVGIVLSTVLLLGALILAFVTTVSVRSRGVTALVQRSVYGDQCEVFARMAAQETLRILRRNAATPGHPAFALLRAGSGESLAFGPEELPRTAAEVATFSGYEVQGATVTLLRKTVLGLDPAAHTEHDTLGVVRVVATATGPRSSRAALTLELGLRTALAVPPRPFDAPTVLILEPSAILANSNEVIESGLGMIPPIQAALGKLAGAVSERVPIWNQLQPDILSILSQKVAEAKREADDLINRKCGFGCSKSKQRRKAYAKIDAYEAAYRAALQPFLDHATEAGATYATLSSRIQGAAGKMQPPPEPHLFPEGIAIMSHADSVELSMWNLPRRVEGPTQAANDAKADLDAALADFQAAYSAHFAALAPIQAAIQAAEYPDVPDIDVGPLEAALQSLEAATGPLESTPLSDRVTALMEVFLDFQDRVIEFGGEPLEEWMERFVRVSPRILAAKAHFVFSGPNAVARFDAHLSRDIPRSGVYYVQHDGTMEIDMTGIEGRLFVISSGDLVVRRATVADPSRDSLTLASYGALEVNGETDAALLPFGRSFTSPGGGWTGSLILPLLRSSDLDVVLQGTVRRQEALVSSDLGDGSTRPPAEPEHVVALLSPAHVYRRLDR